MSVYRLNVYAFIWIRSMVSVRHWPSRPPPPPIHHAFESPEKKSLTILSIIYLILLKCLFHDRQQSTHNTKLIWWVFDCFFFSFSFVYGRPKQTIQKSSNQEWNKGILIDKKNHLFALKMYLALNLLIILTKHDINNYFQNFSNC